MQINDESMVFDTGKREMKLLSDKISLIYHTIYFIVV